MEALFSLLAGLARLTVGAAVFMDPQKVLPQRVRHASFGFVAIFAAFLLAAFLRHFVVMGADLVVVVISTAIWAAICVSASKQCSRRLVVLLGISAGVDLVMIALAIGGLDISNGNVRLAVVAWEIAAMVVAMRRIPPTRRCDVA